MAPTPRAPRKTMPGFAKTVSALHPAVANDNPDDYHPLRNDRNQLRSLNRDVLIHFLEAEFPKLAGTKQLAAHYVDGFLGQSFHPTVQSWLQEQLRQQINQGAQPLRVRPCTNPQNFERN
jgi:hypothetical protein